MSLTESFHRFKTTAPDTRRCTENLDQQAETIAFVSPWRAKLLPPVEMRPAAPRCDAKISLALDFVHGCGCAGGGFLDYNCAGELVYGAGPLVVVLNVESRSQRFFAGHTAPVACLALHRDRVTAASAEASAGGAVLVWDTQSMELMAALRRDSDADAGSGGVACVGFGPDASRLVWVEGRGRVAVWDWRARTRLIVAEAAADGASVGLAVNQFAGAELRVATGGPGGPGFWVERGPRRGGGSDAELVRVPAVGASGGPGDGGTGAVVFVDARTAATGSGSGAILLWMEQQAGRAAGRGTGICYAVVRVVAAAHAGAVTGLRCGGGFLVSGGGDGMVHRWSLAAGRAGRGGDEERVVVGLVSSVDVGEAGRQGDDSDDGVEDVRVAGVAVLCDEEADEVLVAWATLAGAVCQVLHRALPP